MSSTAVPLAALFPEGDYRFHLTLRRGEPAEFFRAQDPSGRLLAERARWLATEPGRYAALQPEGEPAVDEFAQMVREWTSNPLARSTSSGPRAHRGAHARGYDVLIQLGAQLEPDILFLARDAGGRFRLRGGALCFPTGWALEEKLGLPLELIHGPVPGLNASLAPPIQQFLSKLKPGVAFLRDNWGLAATPELNLHPARHIAPPEAPVALDRLWLRVEHQALVALPRCGGIVFGIRIALHRLDTVATDRAAAAGLRRALQTMPDDVAAYKRIDGVRTATAQLL